MTKDRSDRGIAELERLLARASRAVGFTGAGISTESGIPDFRGPQGVWTKDPAAEKMATLDHFVGDPEVRRRAWQTRLRSGVRDARPNAGHHALVDLERAGRLRVLITQNIDGLHVAAGSDPDLVVEIHGNAHRYVCLGCDAGGPMDEALARVRAGEDDPPCRHCGGILKSATISFGQNLVPEDVERAFAAAADCDVFLAVGSTLSVYPVAGTVPTALESGASLVIVNGEPTPFDPVADVVVRARIGEALPAIVAGAGPDAGVAVHHHLRRDQPARRPGL
jgi:NAD-dependent deacetylase